MNRILAIDAGGTKIFYAVLDEKGNFLTEVKKTNTPKKIEDLKQLLINIIKEHENMISYTAIASAGAVNYDNTGIDSATHNMPDGYSSLDFQSLSKKPVFIENDANAAAWAEYKLGAAKGENNTITITIGTGIGGGFIADGRLIRGKSGRAGEIGSIKTSNRGRVCTCGRKNCFESYASGTGLTITAQELAETDETFKAGIYKNKNPKDMNSKDITAGLNLNDAFSKKVFEIWKQDLITGLIAAANIFDPESIVISGGMGKFINTDEIQTAVNKELAVSPVKIKHASSGNYSGLIGAALLAFEKFSV